MIRTEPLKRAIIILTAAQRRNLNVIVFRNDVVVSLAESFEKPFGPPVRDRSRREGRQDLHKAVDLSRWDSRADSCNDDHDSCALNNLPSTTAKEILDGYLVSRSTKRTHGDL